MCTSQNRQGGGAPAGHKPVFYSKIDFSERKTNINSLYRTDDLLMNNCISTAEHWANLLDFIDFSDVAQYFAASPGPVRLGPRAPTKLSSESIPKQALKRAERVLILHCIHWRPSRTNCISTAWLNWFFWCCRPTRLCDESNSIVVLDLADGWIAYSVNEVQTPANRTQSTFWLRSSGISPANFWKYTCSNMSFSAFEHQIQHFINGLVPETHMKKTFGPCLGV